MKIFSSFALCGLFTKALSYLNRYSFIQFIIKVREKIRYNTSYHSWIAKNEPSKSDICLKSYKLRSNPNISLVVPIYNTPRKFLTQMINSVLGQTYPHWELCISDGGSTEPQVKAILEQYAKRNRKIKIKFLRENKGITSNTNEAISLATGEYIAFLDHDDTLSPFALFEVVKAINKYPKADLIYSDEDKISENGKKRFDPYFKPDWNPDLLRSTNYIGHLTVIKKELLEKVGYLDPRFEGSQDYDLVLKASEKATQIVHIPQILYHRRIHGGSVAQDPEQKMYAYEAAQRALEEHLRRIGRNGTVKSLPILGLYKVTYELSRFPLVSIIIPTANNALLKKCVNSIIQKTAYKNWEIIVVNTNLKDEAIYNYCSTLAKNNSKIKFLTWNDKFFNFARVNNFAARYSKGEILLFLNDDTEVINNDWLERMVEHALREEVGAVGAKLYYPNGRIQHAGIIVGGEGIAIHLHKFFHRKSYGYFGRLMAIQNVSAVTGACLMIRKKVFEEVGEFDERFSLAFNDVDLCLSLRKKGYLIVWTPHAELYHHESKTRGYEDTPEKRARFKVESELFLQKWKEELTSADPYYNPNLNPKRGDFSIKV